MIIERSYLEPTYIVPTHLVILYCYLLTIYCKYKQLLYVLLSKKTNISKTTSDLLGSNRKFESDQTRVVGTEGAAGTKQLRRQKLDRQGKDEIFYDTSGLQMVYASMLYLQKRDILPIQLISVSDAVHYRDFMGQFGGIR